MAFITNGIPMIDLEPAHIPAEIKWDATVGVNTLSLKSVTDGYTATIDWGDGQTTSCPVNGGNVTHSYATASNYTVKITGTKFGSFYVASHVESDKYTELVTVGKWATWSTTDFSYMFESCHNLTKVGEDSLKYATEITTIRFAFKSTGLITVPSGLFKYNTKLIDMSYLFGSTPLVALPVDIFRYNTLNTNFEDLCSYCSSLVSLPDDLFTYCLAATNFEDAFKYDIKLTMNANIFGHDYTTRFAGKTMDFNRFHLINTSYVFTGVKGVAPDLWNFTMNLLDSTTAFSQTTVTNTIPAGWY